MGRYFSIIVEHPYLDVNKDGHQYLKNTFDKFFQYYTAKGIDLDYNFNVDDPNEIFIETEDSIIAAIVVYPDFCTIDPFFDDWQLMETSYVAQTAREFAEIFGVKRLWYYCDVCFPEMEKLTDFIDLATKYAGGRIPVIDTNNKLIDGQPYDLAPMTSCNWEAFYEEFE